MGEAVEIPIEGGGSLRLEAELAGGMVPVGRAGDAAVKATQTLQEALAGMQTAIEAVVTPARTLPDPPDKISIQFGIKVGADANLLVSKVAAESNFTVTAEWNRQGTRSADDRK